ncbi:hypothetical protein [Roseibium sediminis]|uniref:hypothetical protein n=1 Tax=Roseibium sediminis TaxID=1775174 RepID=UPI00123D0B5B|nr:hypothetical protein [Roseibium sediminis]
MPPSKPTVFCDIECYHGLFYAAFKRHEDGKRKGFELSHRSELDRRALKRMMMRNRIVTFRGMSYDVPMIFLALSGADTEALKRASDLLIKNNVKWWEAEEALEIKIPKALDHIDLEEPNPAVMQSLKTLNGRLHGKRLQDLPYAPDTILTDEEMDAVIDYCLISDLDATENLFEALREPLELREALGKQYKMDFRSKSDAQMGEAIIKSRIQQLTGQRPIRPKHTKSIRFKYDIPDWVHFETDQMRKILAVIRDTEFVLDKNSKVVFPTEFQKFKIEFGDSTYKMGIGGLHSTEANRSVYSTADRVLIDADVASQYPSIIMKLGLYPKSLGKDFLEVYGGLIKDRLAAKKAKDKVRDKAGKIALNGAYGKLGSPYSVLFAPHLLIAVTLTGQLSLLMLIEKAEAAGIPVVSGNTDGVLFHCPRSLVGGIDGDRLTGGRLKEITDWWEKTTGFKLEFVEYKSIHNQSVNSYFAIRADGKIKRKGPIGNPWSERPEENDLRAQMMKNPQMTICSDAALQYILDGTPVETTIKQCRDVRKFVTVIKATGGATWRDEVLGKVVRYIWSTEGDPIVKVKPHPSTGNRPKVPKTDGCRPLMTLPQKMPLDLDYPRYVAEANKILDEVDFDRSASSPAFTFFSNLINSTL